MLPTRPTVEQFMRQLQATITRGLSTLEPNNQPFTLTPWTKPTDAPLQGHGQMAVLRGTTFAKGGVNFSCVQGTFSEKFAREIPHGWDATTHTAHPFWACGVSLVIHPHNPHCPTVHMNVRHLQLGPAEAPVASWFGGGIDLTPALPYADDTDHFHNTLRTTCAPFGSSVYPAYQRWAADYFFLPHWQEERGVGGIFFDYLTPQGAQIGTHLPAANIAPHHQPTTPVANPWAFTQAVGEAFLPSYVPIIQRRQNTPITPANTAAQLAKRGRYVEFNLLYDRGTRFGFMTGGNPEAILMSLPPLAAW